MDDAAVTRFRRRRIGPSSRTSSDPTLTAEENIALPLLLGRKPPEPAVIEEVWRGSRSRRDARTCPPAERREGQQRVWQSPGAGDPP
jgi:hypothetical protein